MKKIEQNGKLTNSKLRKEHTTPHFLSI